MPGGVPVGTLAIGKAGAKNAGILSASILSVSDKEIEQSLISWREVQSNSVKEFPEG
jgi:5-(carboxyamino)imidazole ribonucleotide mutase